MSIHLRQVCLAARELQPVIDDLCAVFAIEPCYVDPGVGTFGLENTLLPIGTDFLEVVAPVEKNTAAGRYLDRRGGDGGYMVICQVATAEEQRGYRERAAARGVRVAWEAQRDGWRIMQLHPGDMRASFFEVDWDEEADYSGRWEPAGGLGWRQHVRTEVVRGLAGVELQAADPVALAAHWSAVSGIRAEVLDGETVIALENAAIRFVAATDGRGPGLGGIDLEVADRPRLLAQAKERGCHVADDRVMICGVRFRLRE